MLAAAEQAHAADRFAREIIGFLTRLLRCARGADGQAVGQHLGSLLTQLLGL